MEPVVAVMAGLGGLLVGGVLNVLADDLPARARIRPPRYPDGSQRPLRAWLGLSAFALGMREGPSEASANPAGEGLAAAPRPERLGWRHPLLELTTGLAFAGLTLAFADEPALWAWYVYVAILLLITVIDIEHRLILFAVILPSCAFAVVVAAISPAEGRALSEYLLGGVAGFLLFFAMFLGGVAFSTLTRNEEVAFGFGDVMLATLSGLMLGWRGFIFAALITVFAGAVGAVLYMAGRAIIGRYRRFTPLPYGPYIVLGTLVMLLFREEVQRLLQSSYY
ncbi:MAG: A24 family peptidase [Anaerolineae bacterium]|nr:A24 family peptidase [Anaerolineae bacterium]MEB2286896.1 A24 family peptidase [Anaerolineae bacterium]